MWRHIHSARIADNYRAHNGNAKGLFYYYGFAFSCLNRYCSISKCFFGHWLKNIDEDEVDVDELELFDHDPRFWQQPWHFMNYFSEQSNGNFSRSVLFLLYSLGWKLQLLIKMTVGFWNESLIENMQIKSRSVKLNLNKIDGEIRHEDMLYSVGLWHSLICQN